jgi:Ferritin-like domain
MRATRRALLIAAAGPVAAAGPLALGAAPVALAKGPPKELSKAALTAALRLEQTAIVAYEAIANSGVLPSIATAALREFLDQDRQHAQQLVMALEGLGAKSPIPPRRAGIAGLAEVRDVRSAARFAIDLELRTIAAYSSAVHEVGDSNVVRTIAGAMGTDGQQLVVLRQLVHADPVPTAFETGASE